MPDHLKTTSDTMNRYGLTVADVELVQHTMETGLTEEEACAQIADDRAPRPAVRRFSGDTTSNGQ